MSGVMDDDADRETVPGFDRFDAVAEALESLRGIHTIQEPLDVVLRQLAEVACEAIDGADAVSVTAIDGDAAHTVAATDERVVAIDRAQYAAGDGPCLEAARTKRPVRALVHEARERWPDFADAAERLGVRSYLSAPLLIDAEGGGRLLGALDVYGLTEGAFDPVDTALLRILTQAASATISNWHRLQQARELVAQLEQALSSRAEIEQAKGALMALRGLSAEQAFERLVELSQNSNVKLRDVSRQLLESLRNP